MAAKKTKTTGKRVTSLKVKKLSSKQAKSVKGGVHGGWDLRGNPKV